MLAVARCVLVLPPESPDTEGQLVGRRNVGTVRLLHFQRRVFERLVQRPERTGREQNVSHEKTKYKAHDENPPNNQ